MGKTEKWLQSGEAQTYYGISVDTLHRYRKKGIVTTRPSTVFKQKAFEYLADEQLRDAILYNKTIDKRWK